MTIHKHKHLAGIQVYKTFWYVHCKTIMWNGYEFPENMKTLHFFLIGHLGRYLCCFYRTFTFLVHLDQRPMWTITMTWRPSSVVCKLFTFQASSPKPLGQLEPNLPGMFLGWSSTNFHSIRIFNMAASANNMLWLTEIFFFETNELTEPKL